MEIYFGWYGHIACGNGGLGRAGCANAEKWSAIKYSHGTAARRGGSRFQSYRWGYYRPYDGRRVRYIGINTPELSTELNPPSVMPRKQQRKILC